MINTSSFRRIRLYKTWLFILVLGSSLLNSCVTSKKITYLQDYARSEYSGDYAPPDDYLIQPNDNLYVQVSTPDPRWSEIFNPMSGGGTMAMGGSNTTQLISYPVQLDGTVNLPYLDKVQVGDMTLSEAKKAIETVLIDYIVDASVTIRLVNSYVTLLGEVNAPGMYEITKERLNIFQAIALAGDVADFGNRYKISIIRQTHQGSVTKVFDITDENIIDSEYYYIFPNDVIYVQPMKRKFFGMAAYPYGMLLGIIASAVSLFILIQNQILLQQ